MLFAEIKLVSGFLLFLVSVFLVTGVGFATCAKLLLQIREGKKTEHITRVKYPDLLQ